MRNRNGRELEQTEKHEVPGEETPSQAERTEGALARGREDRRPAASAQAQTHSGRGRGGAGFEVRSEVRIAVQTRGAARGQTSSLSESGQRGSGAGCPGGSRTFRMEWTKRGRAG